MDEVYEAYPQLWTSVMKANPYLTGRQISQMVRCTIAQSEAMITARQGATHEEREEIYEREMATALCFVSGTIVKTETGDEVIENIQVGDYVWAHNPETGETALKRVAQTFRNETTKLVTITAENDVIEATPEHPFYVLGCDEPRGHSTGLGKGWVKAKDLRKGDVLVLLDGSKVTVDNVTTTKLAEPITVYNFEVEDFHTYFVGTTGLLVHNSCTPFTSAQSDVINRAKAVKNTGLSEADAWALWSDAVHAGFYKGPRYHPPGFDSFGGGTVYHMKINGYHIKIY